MLDEDACTAIDDIEDENYEEDLIQEAEKPQIIEHTEDPSKEKISLWKRYTASRKRWKTMHKKTKTEKIGDFIFKAGIVLFIISRIAGLFVS